MEGGEMLGEICKLQNICKSYGNKNILQNFSLTIDQGDFLAITGISGSGKTTLLNIIGLLEKPDSGKFHLFGTENPFRHSRLVTEILRHKLAYLFQNYALMDNETISKNLDVALVYSKKTKKEKEKLKKEVLAQTGLDLELNQKVYELSGGEQQRLAISRMLLKPFELVLADEPTGSLDATNRDEILNILKQLHQNGKTIVIVTHDFTVSSICNRLIQLG